jgi:hypothetical protein
MRNRPSLFFKGKGVTILKFRDLFLPRIARSDPEVRKDAIRNEVNVELLKQVIQKESDPAVIDVARNRIQELNPNYAYNK